MAGINNGVGRVLGDLSANEFLADYWQKTPLLIRNGLSDLPTLSADELAGLALEDEIESRLVLTDQQSANWQLRQGPLSEQDLTSLPPSHWTLLVQAVDQWLPEVHDLLDHFNFIPRWRLDDIMVSLSADQGSVGPHFDNYDVFLVQTHGNKYWRIGQHCEGNTALVEDAPLRLLQDFQQQREYLLAPGDMLYLPPRIAHWGIAKGDDSMTFSVGFRAPTAVELLDDLATELMANPKLSSQPFIDPPLSLGQTGGEINVDYLGAVKKLLIEQLSDDKLLSEWFARFMTTRKYPDMELLSDDDKPRSSASWTEYPQLAWHPASRIALITPYPEDEPKQNQDQATLAVDGELHTTSQQLAILLNGQQKFSRKDLVELSKEELDLVAQLVQQGSLQPLDDNNGIG